MPTLTFVEPVGQQVVPGSVLKVLLAVDGVHVLPPVVGVQSPKELLHRVEGRDGLVQVVHGVGVRCRRPRPRAIVLQGGPGRKEEAENHFVLVARVLQPAGRSSKHPFIPFLPVSRQSSAASSRS